MIFVTVGSELPFDRMVRVIDQWASSVDEQVVAQIGDTDLIPENILWCKFMEPPEFSRSFAKASLIIAHSGTGTMLAALQYGKPILVMPRLSKLHETRNDHQVATVERFEGHAGIYVAMDENILVEKLNKIDRMKPGDVINDLADDALIQTIRDFIQQ